MNQLTSSTDSIEHKQVNGSETLPIKGDTYQLDMDIAWSDIKNAGVRLRESADQS
ncbi:hypothetical protein ACSE3M_10535 [Bacillus velezensis]